MFDELNTNGFTKEQLAQMNEELEALMSDVDIDGPDYHQIEKWNSTFILKKYGGV
jgi:hypothetical protein